jgi:WXG100 family type VII secretion target
VENGEARVAVDGFGTTTEEMARAAQHVASVNAAVQGELTALRGRLEPLAGAWVGRASTQFAALMARWDADARSLNQALGAIGQAIDGSRVTYERQEEAQAAAMTSISNALG